MRLAKSVCIPGANRVDLGDIIEKRIIDRIEIYHDEYDNHSEMNILFYNNGIIIRKMWNCPVDIIYLN